MQRVEYQAGNEHNPSDPFGRVELDLTGDGAVRVEHRGRSGNRSWTATVDSAFLDELGAALAEAGFPEAPRSLPMPGERIRRLHVTGQPCGTVDLLWYEALQLSGYRQAFQLLDALVTAVGGPDTGAPALRNPPTGVESTS